MKMEQVPGQMTLFPLVVDFGNKVYMSNELVVGRQDLSLNSTKTLRVLFSKVLKDDLDFKEYSIGVGELANALNTSTSCISRDAMKIVNELAFRGLCIKSPSGRIDAINWAPTSVYDPENSEFHFKLNERLAPYLLGLEDYFTCYSLDVAREFRSVYGLRLYELLKKENYGADFSINHPTDVYLSVKDIRFACALDDYDANGNMTKSRLVTTAHLKQRLINPAIAEIEKVFPTLTVTYEPKSAGNRTVGFFFKIKPLGVK